MRTCLRHTAHRTGNPRTYSNLLPEERTRTSNCTSTVRRTPSVARTAAAIGITAGGARRAERSAHATQRHRIARRSSGADAGTLPTTAIDRTADSGPVATCGAHALADRQIALFRRSDRFRSRRHRIRRGHRSEIDLSMNGRNYKHRSHTVVPLDTKTFTPSATSVAIAAVRDRRALGRADASTAAARLSCGTRSVAHRPAPVRVTTARRAAARRRTHASIGNAALPRRARTVAVPATTIVCATLLSQASRSAAGTVVADLASRAHRRAGTHRAAAAWNVPSQIVDGSGQWGTHTQRLPTHSRPSGHVPKHVSPSGATSPHIAFVAHPPPTSQGALTTQTPFRQTRDGRQTTRSHAS